MNINVTLFMQAIAFAGLIWFCARFVWPPLMRAVDARQKTIADGLAAGEAGRQNLANAEKHRGDVHRRLERIVLQTKPHVTETGESGRDGHEQHPIETIDETDDCHRP